MVVFLKFLATLGASIYILFSDVMLLWIDTWSSVVSREVLNTLHTTSDNAEGDGYHVYLVQSK